MTRDRAETPAADAKRGRAKPGLRRPIRVLALRDLDERSLLRSASGGAFAVLARATLASGGVVFGAEMCDDGLVRMTAVESEGELWRLQGSKYVQSAAGDAFRRCVTYLETGRDVLFSGLPCQVYALRGYVDSRCAAGGGRLLTCDLVCHGVTSPELLRLYLGWLEERVGAKPGTLSYTFRSKERPWGLHYQYSYVSRRNGKPRGCVGEFWEDPYYRAFLSGRYYRNSCYSCKFASPERPGDFTIGDYWGIERAHPAFYDERGVSLLMLNTPEATRFFGERCAATCAWVESTLELACAENSNLRHPSARTTEDEAAAERLREAVAAGDAELVFGRLLREPGAKGYLKSALPRGLVAMIQSLKAGCRRRRAGP